MSIHVTCGPAPGNIANGNLPVDLAKLDWSQTLSAPGLSQAAPTRTGRTVVTVVTIDAAAWVAVGGSSPDAGVDPRRYIPAGCSQSFAVEAGDKIAWAAV